MNTKETAQVMGSNWTSNSTNNIDIMMSVYDYLGKPAGRKLGKEVYEAAKTEKIPTASKQVSNPKYEGKIIMYPKSFLDKYFKKEDNNKLPF